MPELPGLIFLNMNYKTKSNLNITKSYVSFNRGNKWIRINAKSEDSNNCEYVNNIL